MKLEKAIEILTKWRDKGEGDGEELEEAENLGIEALKKIQSGRDYECSAAPVSLPRETE